MWMDDDDAPTRNHLFTPPLSVTLGAESPTVFALIGAVSGVVNRHKAGEKSIFCIADMNIGDGDFAARVVDEYRDQCKESSRIVKVSGFDTDCQDFQKAESLLAERDALGILREADIVTTPSGRLRNYLECGAGADMVLYAHAAYPAKLQKSKLPRMVDRLGDMALEKGAIISLHNYGPADVDDIPKHALALPIQMVAGVFCNTQGDLETQFEQHQELHSFSVTVPNTIELPANIAAVKAILEGKENRLGKKDAADAEIIAGTLAKLVDGAEQLYTILRRMGDEQRAKAMDYFTRRITLCGGRNLLITVGGGQMVMAFKSVILAKEAFFAVNELCQRVTPPAIALPVSTTIMPEFNKVDAHETWKAQLGVLCVTPPQVHQAGVRP